SGRSSRSRAWKPQSRDLGRNQRRGRPPPDGLGRGVPALRRYNLEVPRRGPMIEGNLPALLRSLSGRKFFTLVLVLATLPLGCREQEATLEGEKILDYTGPMNNTVALSPDGRTLAAVSRDGGDLRLWDVATGKEGVRLEGARVFGPCLEFSPDGKTLALGS